MKVKGAHNSYWGNIREGVTSSLKGLALTLKHLWDARKKRPMVGVEHPDYFDQKVGIVTLEYPHEAIPVPDNGRYRLHNEIDDCIVCDLCAKICPVNCIEIEPIKSTEEIGKTSDGSTKRIYAAKFDIDMAKCCYCGLCTTVCPTECLTMTKTYDYSEFDIRNMVYHFSDLTPDQANEKKKVYEEQQKEKERAKAAALEAKAKSQTTETPVTEKTQENASEVKKPAFKPVIKPPVPKKSEEGNDKASKEETKQTIEPAQSTETPVSEKSQEKPAESKKVVFKPVIKPAVSKNTEEGKEKVAKEESNQKVESTQSAETPVSEKPQENTSDIKKPVFKPVIKPPVQKKTDDDKDKKE